MARREMYYSIGPSRALHQVKEMEKKMESDLRQRKRFERRRAAEARRRADFPFSSHVLGFLRDQARSVGLQGRRREEGSARKLDQLLTSHK